MSEKVPRLQRADLEERLAETLAPRIERLGYLGEFFQVMAHNPDVLREFMEFTEALKTALPNALTEVASLTVAVRTGSEYERNQHERLCLKLGFSRDWIAEVEACDPDAAHLMDDKEKAAQVYALSALKDFGRGAKADFDRLVEAAGPAHACAVAMTVGRYMCHALVVNTFELAPPVASPLRTSSAEAAR